MHQTATAQQRSIEPEWFASWFDSAHYQRLYAHRDDREASAFIDRLIQRLPIKPGGSVLDLGCGNGRHAIRLAARGFDVTGIDLSAESLALARARESERVRWTRQDMRHPFGTEAYDCVLSPFTSFGYFDDPGDHLRVVENIARSLRTGGLVVFDYLNVRHAEARLVREEMVHREGVDYGISRWSDAHALFKRIRIADGRGRSALEFVERVAKLAAADFQFMFALCGLSIEAVFGDYELTSFGPETSPRLVLVARRPTFTLTTCATGSCGCGLLSRVSCRDKTRAWFEVPAAQWKGRRARTLEVTLLRGAAQSIDDALVLRGGVALQASAKRGGLARDAIDQALPRAIGRH